jgi:hypothetical protein
MATLYKYVCIQLPVQHEPLEDILVLVSFIGLALPLYNSLLRNSTRLSVLESMKREGTIVFLFDELR